MGRSIGRIERRSTFATLRQEGHRVRSGPLALTWVNRADASDVRVAYAVGRAVGGAVVRNRVRRRLRAVLEDQVGELRPGAYLVGATAAAVDLTPREMREHVSTALARLHRPAYTSPLP